MKAHYLVLAGVLSLVLMTAVSACAPGRRSLVVRSALKGIETPPPMHTPPQATCPSPAVPLMSGYPRIANLWGKSDPQLGVQLLDHYDLFIPYELSDPANQVGAIRAANPNARVLFNLEATHGPLGLDPLATEWANSMPGDLGYNCLLRDSRGTILLVEYWEHPMYNLTVPYCRQLVLERTFRANVPLYDGIFWDLLYDSISWLGNDIDSNLDGRPDDPAALDAAYRAGVEDYLVQVRARLPRAILVGNEASSDYAAWINGRLFEWQLSELLNGTEELTWDSVLAAYRDWAGRGCSPHMTFIQSAPEPFYTEKFPFQHVDEMPRAMMEEAAASYQRMRFGLTSALMGDGLFSFDLGPVEHGQPWWYDEFGAPAVQHPTPRGEAATLPPRGYLGQPIGLPRLLIDGLRTPDQVRNSGFEDGLSNWQFWVDMTDGAAASLQTDPSGGISGTGAAHITIARAVEPWSVMVFQPGIATMANEAYTLSFWARSDVTRTLSAKVAKILPPGTDYGVKVQTLVTPEWQHFNLSARASVTADDGELDFLVGERQGELWLDDVEFRQGALGVWARPFERGLAVVNSTRYVQTAQLPGTYCKLNGRQAPLFQVLVDDDEALPSAGWSQQLASGNQFGKTVHVAPAGTGDTITYRPTLAYGGEYEVFAWVAPAANQSSGVQVTIHHTQGIAQVSLSERPAEGIGWHSLGTYFFDAGKTARATLAATGDGVVVADAFKWVSTARYNDGRRVSQITLQPQDGIVLLSSCYGPATMTDASPIPRD
jgi:hypothetical protein